MTTAICNYTAGVIKRAVSKTFAVSKPYFRNMASEGKSEHIPGADPSSRLIWLDLELTGLSLEKDRILEVACTITEANLDIVAMCPDLIIHQSEEVLNEMLPWCQETHRKSGLVGEVLKSTLTENEAENQLLEFVRKYTTKGMCPLAGNTVYMDRFFLMKYMPTLEQHIHYRIVDVSTVKEACRRWCRDVYSKAPEKKFIHRAGVDVSESIEELKYYKKIIFDSRCA